MSAAPECDKVLLVQAELDGELDAAEAATLAVHRAGCPICQAAAAELSRARALIEDDLYEPMPQDVRGRIMTRIASDSHRLPLPNPPPQAGEGRVGVMRRSERWGRFWWPSTAGFGLGAACAAALFFLVLAPGAPNLADEVVASHIRALQPGHLEDVPSSDRHTVKPWFDGRIDFAPTVKDLAAQRFPLQGGRLDYLDGRPVAALVYRRDKHIINLFTWPDEAGPTSPEIAQRQGYNIVHWSQNGMALWAVSDLEAGQLREFAEDWRRSP